MGVKYVKYIFFVTVLTVKLLEAVYLGHGHCKTVWKSSHLHMYCNCFSGGLAGLSLMWYRSSSIALYLAAKIFEVRMKEVLPVVSFPRL